MIVPMKLIQLAILDESEDTAILGLYSHVYLPKMNSDYFKHCLYKCSPIAITPPTKLCQVGVMTIKYENT